MPTYHLYYIFVLFCGLISGPVGLRDYVPFLWKKKKRKNCHSRVSPFPWFHSLFRGHPARDKVSFFKEKDKKENVEKKKDSETSRVKSQGIHIFVIRKPAQKKKCGVSTYGL